MKVLLIVPRETYMTEKQGKQNGRPTTWSEELEEQAWAYINGGWEKEEHAVPSVVGLCKVLKRGKSTLYDWAEDKEKGFSDILAAIKEEQELVTFNKSLKNEYNATIAKLLLGKHGYHDKQDNTNAGPDGGPIQVIDATQLSTEALKELVQARAKSSTD